MKMLFLNHCDGFVIDLAQRSGLTIKRSEMKTESGRATQEKSGGIGDVRFFVCEPLRLISHPETR